MSKAEFNKIKLNSYTLAEEFGAKGDGVTDDTIAIQTALNTKKYVELVAGKTYVVADLQGVENGALVCLNGRATLKVKTGLFYNGIIVTQRGFTLKGVNFEGGAVGPFNVPSPTPGQRNGIVIGHPHGALLQTQDVTIEDCDVTGFNNAGVYGRETVSGFSFGKRVVLHNVNCYGNYVNFWCTPHFEYAHFTQCYGYKGFAGVIVQGGNNKFTSCSFESNYQNCQLSGGDNNSHGGFVNCSFNHSESGYGLFAIGVDWGMSFTNCFFWYGNIYLEACKGVKITQSQIVASSITIKDGGVNNIDENYTIDPIVPNLIGYTFTTFRNNRTNSTDNSYASIYGDVYMQSTSTAYGATPPISTNKVLTNLRPVFEVKKYHGVDQSWLQSSDYFYVPRTGKYNVSASIRMNIGASNETIKLAVGRYTTGPVLQETFIAGQYYPASTQAAVITLNAPVIARGGDLLGMLISTETVSPSTLTAMDVRITSVD